jgi:hypothetical protein
LSNWIAGLAVGLAVGLPMTLTVKPLLGPRYGWLVVGLGLTLFSGLIYGLDDGPIEPFETIRWSPKQLLKNPINEIGSSLISGLLV